MQCALSEAIAPAGRFIAPTTGPDPRPTPRAAADLGAWLQLLLWSVCACATGPRPVPRSENAELAAEILGGEGAAPLSLYLDSEWYFSKSETPARGRLEEDEPQSAAVDLLKVGHASKMLCRYSKLRVRFPGARPHEQLLDHPLQ